MDRKLFFDRVRQAPYGGRVSAKGVSGIEAALTALHGWPTRHVAYALATILAECGREMQPVREGFKATDAAARAYVKSKGYRYAKPEGPERHVWYGRGWVQLTWRRNYVRAERDLGIPFASQPDLALKPANAALILRRGMEEGWFTGKKLSDYLGGSKADYKGARRIINGQDRAAEIAGYALAFEAALRAAGWGEKPAPKPKPEKEAPPVVSDPPKVDEAVVDPPEEPWWSPIKRQLAAGLAWLGVSASAAWQAFVDGIDRVPPSVWIILVLAVIGIGLVTWAVWWQKTRKPVPTQVPTLVATTAAALAKPRRKAPA